MAALQELNAAEEAEEDLHEVRKKISIAKNTFELKLHD
jgi:hypothetical protein